MESKMNHSLETYQQAMFPLMLQALYNAKIAFSMYRVGRLNHLDGGDGVKRTAMDIDVIIDAFKSIGITRRYKKERVKKGTFKLHHFHQEEIAEIVELFSPDAEERDTALQEIKDKANASRTELMEIIRRRNSEKTLLSQELCQAQQEIQRLNGELAFRINASAN